MGGPWALGKHLHQEGRCWEALPLETFAPDSPAPGLAEKPPFGRWGPHVAQRPCGDLSQAGALLSINPTTLPGLQTHNYSLSMTSQEGLALTRVGGSYPQGAVGLASGEPQAWRRSRQQRCPGVGELFYQGQFPGTWDLTPKWGPQVHCSDGPWRQGGAGAHGEGCPEARAAGQTAEEVRAGEVGGSRGPCVRPGHPQPR